jgi:TetR/AcrR family transcriptional regulator
MTAWAERLGERSPIVQRSRDRSLLRARVLIDAARRLIAVKGESFTTHDLVKEAGVALQTFYRYFASKDELLLAVIEDMVIEACVTYEARAEGITDPIARLHSHITSVVDLLAASPDGGAYARFIATEHWRLSRQFPREIASAAKPYVDLLHSEISAATDAGVLRSVDPERDAWLTSQLVMAVFQHHSFSAEADPTLAADLWRYCLGGLGGTVEPAVPPKTRPLSRPRRAAT